MSESTLLVGGRVFTGRRYCEALLIENGQVLVAGSEAETRRAAPTGVELRSLRGALVLPGLIDAHFHIADVTRSREGLNLGGITSVEALVEKVREWSSEHPGRSVVGRGWDPERSASRAWPSRRDLDRASPDRPTVVLHVSGHAGVANSAALAAAGIDRASNDPVGGRIGRDADGTPDGRVFESGLRELIGRPDDLDLPAPAALRRTMAWAATFGLTTLGAMSAAPEEALALADLSRSGKLPGRVRVYLHSNRWEEYFRVAPSAAGPAGRFAVVGVKAYTDGAFGTRTAWLSEPYADETGTSGLPVAAEENLRAVIAAAAGRGLAPALHAIGDRAVEFALRMLEPLGRLEHAPARVEHAALTPPTVFAALARVRPALVVQPGFIWSDHWLAQRLGAPRTRWAYAFRSLIRQGHLLAGSSDAPYDPADPWRGIRAAVERADAEGRSANPTPEEALQPEEALGLYTLNAGIALGEPALGLLEPGSPADLVLLGSSSLERAIAEGSASVQETWVDGHPVAHRRGGEMV
ncbi:MAG: amidohydrolase [Thermoplasmata archaeon]|nr:amidohydrolase [Thermoplasmata archaeon]